MKQIIETIRTPNLPESASTAWGTALAALRANRKRPYPRLGWWKRLAHRFGYPLNVWVADTLPKALRHAEEQYGFQTILLTEGEPLPFPDQFFDIVFCSSVIQHVTIPNWHLLTPRLVQELFPEAKIAIERWYGLPKSIIAYRV